MPDVFNLSIPHLTVWSQRAKVDHRAQNEPVQALNQLTTGIAPPRMRMGKGDAIGGATKIGIALIDAFTDDPDVLSVRLMRSDGAFATTDEAQSAFVWPNTVQEDYRTFLGTDIAVMVLHLSGVSYVMQQPRWEMMLPPAGVQIGDCRF